MKHAGEKDIRTSLIKKGNVVSFLLRRILAVEWGQSKQERKPKKNDQRSYNV